MQKPLIETDGAEVFGASKVLWCKMDTGTNLVHRFRGLLYMMWWVRMHTRTPSHTLPKMEGCH